MSQPPREDLSPELLDDFYNEADEHLTTLRKLVAELEEAIAADRALEASSWHALGVSFHSLKGISALAGVAPAERLTHAAEDFLRAAARNPGLVTEAGAEALMRAVQRLEQIVAAHRAKGGLPDIAEEIAALHQGIPGSAAALPRPENSSGASPATAAGTPLQVRIEEARLSGRIVWRCRFAPTRELDQRGVNINAVRVRLTSLGEVLESAPVIHPGRGIEFHFVLALTEPPSDLGAWTEDGIVFEPTEAEAATPAPTTQGGTEAAAPHDPFVAPSRFVRVDIERLDDLMRVMSDLVVHRARIDDQMVRLAERSPDGQTEALSETVAGLGRSLRDLKDAIMRIRLVPVAQLFERLPFVVRDLITATGKRVRVAISGQGTEVDKFIIERLKDPLLHLVRNAVSHGIESAAERKAQGKPEEAVITLAARSEGSSVVITVSDDGRGIDARKVFLRASSEGLSPGETRDAAALLALLCRPGFSTRDEADRASGRGLGMAVAHDVIRQLGGTLRVETQLGKGTTFILRLPLTLAIADVFVVAVAGRLFAVPQTSIRETMELEEARVRRVGRSRTLHYRNGLLPLVYAADFLHVPASSSPRHVLVLETERGWGGLAVDRIIGHREVVVRPLQDPLAQGRGVAAATELGDGRPILILDVPVVMAGAVRPREESMASAR